MNLSHLGIGKFPTSFTWELLKFLIYLNGLNVSTFDIKNIKVKNKSNTDMNFFVSFKFSLRSYNVNL